MRNSILISAIAAVVVLVLLVPLIRGKRRGDRPPPPVRDNEAVVSDAVADTALQEIELDHDMGRLNDSDYAELRAKYEREPPAAIGRKSADVAPAPAQRHRPRPGTSPGGGRSSTRTAVASGRTSRRSRADLDVRAEELVRHYRGVLVSCAVCGDRPESDARFCSSCGRYLAPCPGCGRAIDQLGARFCPACGRALAG